MNKQTNVTVVTTAIRVQFTGGGGGGTIYNVWIPNKEVKPPFCGVR